jgi:hypothetical protein
MVPKASVNEDSRGKGSLIYASEGRPKNGQTADKMRTAPTSRCSMLDKQIPEEGNLAGDALLVNDSGPLPSKGHERPLFGGGVAKQRRYQPVDNSV